MTNDVDGVLRHRDVVAAIRTTPVVQMIDDSYSFQLFISRNRQSKCTQP